jgi:hypothetical protein
MKNSLEDVRGQILREEAKKRKTEKSLMSFEDFD